MQTIAAMNEFQNIIGEDTGWNSEEDMLKDMAEFRRERLFICQNELYHISPLISLF